MTDTEAKPVSYDGATFFVRGERILLLAGSVHYPRVHPSRWNVLFETFRAAGLNTVETYVFWSEHQASLQDSTRGESILENVSAADEYDFTGRRDVFGFLRAAFEAGLHAILRIGPYVCAEVSYGGFPFALRDIPGMRFRTLNQPFQDAVAKWLRFVARQLHERKLLASAGGPVLLVQLENEYQMVAGAYGDEGAKYLQWCADLQHELNFGVPTIMCFGAADGAVETINAFYAHECLSDLRRKNKNQPAMWTECWTGWYDVWGAPHHRRPATDLAYAVARYFASGGGGICYYMWMGGTNVGRSPMYLQATSYDYDAPVDEFYMATTKAKHLTALHMILLDYYAPALFAHGSEAAGRDDFFVPPVAHQLAEFVVYFQWSPSLGFVCNDSEYDGPPEVTVPGSNVKLVQLPPRTVRIINPVSGRVLYDSSVIDHGDAVARELRAVSIASGRVEWRARSEPIVRLERTVSTGDSRRRREASSPPEQLSLTKDTSDYCFFSASFEWVSPVAKAEALEGVLFSMEACDFVYVYVNGEFVCHSDEPLWEDRKKNRWNSRPDAPGFAHSLRGRLPDIAREENEFTVTVLVCALGLVKGDWQLGDGLSANMLEEKKGLLSDVAIGIEEGEEYKEVASRTSAWTAIAGLLGEEQKWPEVGLAVSEEAGTLDESQNTFGQGRPVWLDGTFWLGEMKSSLVLDLGGMGKGLLWVNGILLGRYWSVEGTRPRNGFLDGAPIVQDAFGSHTQRYYHIPEWALRPDDDSDSVPVRITLFEERGKNPCTESVSLYYWDYKDTQQ